jgi:hypothetical protein
MKAFIASIAADVRANPDVAFLWGVVVAGEVAATTTCLYFAATFPVQTLH